MKVDAKGREPSWSSVLREPQGWDWVLLPACDAQCWELLLPLCSQQRSHHGSSHWGGFAATSPPLSVWLLGIFSLCWKRASWRASRQLASKQQREL